MAGVLGNATALVHLLCLVYIGLGGFLGWRWPRTLLVHVFFAAWGFIVILASVPCPLTVLQDHLRHVQGLPSMPGGFNEYYIYGELIPHAWLPATALLAVVLLIMSYVGAYLQHRRRVQAAGTAAGAQPVG